MIEEVKRSRINSDKYPYSRYRNLDRIEYEDGVEIIEVPNKVVVKRSTNDQYFNVTDEFENRLDLISYKFYNTPKLWWVIAYASNIIDPFEVPVGARLRIPPLTVALSNEVV